MLGHSTRPTSAGQITYQVLGTLTDVEAISAEWDSLLSHSPCNRAFSCAKWFLASCSLDRSLNPYVIIARRGAALAGLLPLVLVKDHEAATLATFPSELSDYNDIIARQDDDAVALGLLTYAGACRDDYQRVVLSRLRLDSNCARAAELFEPEGKSQRVFQTRSGCQYIDLASSYEDYLLTRSRNFRKSLNRAQRDAAKHNLIIRELTPEQFSPCGLAEDFLNLNLDRWGADSYYGTPFVQAFVRKLLPDLFKEGRMRAFALLAGERLLGLDLCMVGANSLCSWNGGFLSEAARWSPGKLLIAAGIRHAYRMNMAEYDLLRGAETYKASWANCYRDLGWLEIAVAKPPLTVFTGCD